MRTLRLPALAVRQTPGRTVYAFAVDGKRLRSFVDISRARRDDPSAIAGYQRPEIRAHVAAIRAYLESADPMIPNALVVSFDRIVFEADSGKGDLPIATGTLVVPVPERDGEPKPGWLVDGQQRSAAIDEAAIDSFPVVVTAFVAADPADQREQFVLVNSARPLPKGLVHELLPSITGPLPPALVRKRLPAALLERLNHDVDSPLEGLVRTPTTPSGVIKDNSMLRCLENSLTDGALHRHREAALGNGDLEEMLDLLKDYWAAVRDVFPEAWGKPPRRSRLMHGVGILTMGFLMDTIADDPTAAGAPTRDEFAVDLERIAPSCRWTAGTWDFGRPWNEVQNTSQDIGLVTRHLASRYAASCREVARQREAGPS